MRRRPEQRIVFSGQCRSIDPANIVAFGCLIRYQVTLFISENDLHIHLGRDVIVWLLIDLGFALKEKRRKRSVSQAPLGHYKKPNDIFRGYAYTILP